MPIVFDIETGPAENLAEIIPPFDSESVKLGNLKDPEKIAAKLAESERDWVADHEAKAGLSAIYGRVLAIGLHRVGDEENAVKVLGAGCTEPELLMKFWDLFCWAENSKTPLIGWNSNRFDVPFLVRRSIILGLFVPPGLFSFTGGSVRLSPIFIDLMQRWACGVYGDFQSLDGVARAMGIGAKNGKATDFARLWLSPSEDDRKQAVAYLENDVLLTLRVAQKMGVV